MKRNATCDYARLMSPDPTESNQSPIDLTRIERDLADVETALARLEAGTYWTDEVTGAPIPDAVLESNPLARRAATDTQP